jgi:hypothetical protein
MVVQRTGRELMASGGIRKATWASGTGNEIGFGGDARRGRRNASGRGDNRACFEERLGILDTAGDDEITGDDRVCGRSLVTHQCHQRGDVHAQGENWFGRRETPQY